jgi:hypothetical protein
MQTIEVLDLTLAEVRELIKDKRHQWRDRAMCLGLDTERFIRQDNLRGKNQLQIYKDAIKICQQCPVRSECCAFAVEHYLIEGVWGGLIPAQRKGLKYFSTMREIFKKRDKK